MMLALLLNHTAEAVTGTDVVKEYCLDDIGFSEADFVDSLCPVLAESTYTWYNQETGLVNSEHNYTSSHKENCCYWKTRYDHGIFPDGTRRTRYFKFNTHTDDTGWKSLQTIGTNGQLIAADDFILPYNHRSITAYTYNEQGNQTAYYHSVRPDGKRDTSHVELTEYDKTGRRPLEKLYPCTKGRRIYICNGFDSVVAKIAVLNGKKRVSYVTRNGVLLGLSRGWARGRTSRKLFPDNALGTLICPNASA